jgi:uncharacterized protein YciU (UPF0263 family)
MEASMPFRSIAQDDFLTPKDLDFLQDVYEEATIGIANVDDAMMHDVVSTLIMHYRAGEKNRNELVAIAMRDMRRAFG